MMCGYNVCYEELPICGKCISLLQETLTEKCLNCGKTAYTCECHDSDGLRFVFYYSGYVSKKLIRLAKTDMDVKVIEFLAELAVNACNINMGSYDGVAFVPRHRRNLKKFGHNQAEEFAKALSRRYGIPIIDVLRRVGGREQKLLSRAERINNIKSNYKIKEDYKVNEKYNKILLVDDIYTTGATIRSCAELLRKNVTRAVTPLTFAKTNFRIKKGVKK